MYLLLLPPIAVAVALLVIGLRRRTAARPPSGLDAMEAHRRYVEALDPRAPQRKAAQEAMQDAPTATKRISRHA